MKKISVFLFILIFFSPELGNSGVISEKIKNIGISKIKESVVEDHSKDNSFRVDNLDLNDTTWHKAQASYYDPIDQSQTKENPDGVGAFGRKINSGSIALGSKFTKAFIKKDATVFIEVKELSHIKTPYGYGIFRVDDRMGDRFTKDNKFFVDFYRRDLPEELRRLGRFRVSFRFLSFHNQAESFS